MNAPIYLDYNATTPVAPEVADAIEPYLRKHFGNPSSSHVYGIRAKKALDEARAEVASLLGAHSDEIIFTGSATEANNLAILGTALCRKEPGHIVISAVEHPAVAEPVRHLQNMGWQVTALPTDEHGRVNPSQLESSLQHNTALVSIMHSNNEVGTLQPIQEIASIVRARGIPMHTDASQSAGKIALDVKELGVDLLTLAGHKFYAPKGVGALYVRRGTMLRPVLFGAMQERGLRASTENVALCAGLGRAAVLARESLPQMGTRLEQARDRLHNFLREAIPDLALNGHPLHRLPNTLNLSFPRVSGRALLASVETQVAASVGSACHSEGDAVSGVLAAMGVSAAQAMGAVRLSVGRYTTDEEIEHAAKALIDAWRKLAN